MNNNPQRRLLNSHFDRSAANVFTIGINIEWMLRFHAQARSRKIFDLADAKMPPKINAGKHAEQLERIDTAHHADIEQAVVHLRAGSDLHPSAIHGSVGEGRKDCGLMAANGPAFMPRRIQAVLIGAEIFTGNGANRNTDGIRLSAYPPCPRSHRGKRFARRATSLSRPTPATQQK